MAVFIVDTRNQKDSFVVKSLLDRGHRVLRSKLPFGDVALSSNILNAIDLKSSGGGLNKKKKNRFSSDRDRLRREIDLAIEYGGKLTFLCFEPRMHTLEDIAKWNVPRFKSDKWGCRYVDKKTGKIVSQTNAKKYKNGELEYKRVKIQSRGDTMTKVKPVSLMKSIMAMCAPNHYADGFTVGFAFATKTNCGRIIEEILLDNRDKM